MWQYQIRPNILQTNFGPANTIADGHIPWKALSGNSEMARNQVDRLKRTVMSGAPMGGSNTNLGSISAKLRSRR